eukprot:CAMPEP_0113580918 /NCGR_PEP_ID=MMETSP0015_2-20120614/30964_1 /TAXON_ID=2838 /ORGANISM="Odontella" /LENGTH=62 /DNA_ID=CAMNT_0000485209 /DNA_START=328 /DNA_END=513 /DNA_ORIENTATION=+ /assembly_acc=CAM_ASM_000160
MMQSMQQPESPMTRHRRKRTSRGSSEGSNGNGGGGVHFSGTMSSSHLATPSPYTKLAIGGTK